MNHTGAPDGLPPNSAAEAWAEHAPVYPHLAWRWTLLGVPWPLWLPGLVPAAALLCICQLTRLGQAHPAWAVPLWGSLCAWCWARLLGAGRRDAKWLLTGGAAAAALALCSGCRCALPLWLVLPLAWAGLVGVGVLQVGSPHPGLHAASWALGAQGTWSPFVRGPPAPEPPRGGR